MINIIIPTYNRPRYLKQLLDYYNKYESDFNIVVADSSSSENKKLNRETVLSFPGLKVQYIDKYSEKYNPYHKLVDILNYAKEKYCVFCGDDDFLTANGISQSVAFLEKNPDFTVAHGYYAGFSLKTKKGKKKQFYWETRSSKESIIFPEPEKRLFKHLSEYSLQTFYGVHQTEFLKMIFKEALDYKIDIMLFGELLLGELTLIHGKMKYLNVMYMARQTGPRSDYRPTPLDYMKEGKYDAEYEKFKQCLAAHLSKNSQLKMEESKKIIDEAMFLYLKKYCFPSFKKFLRNKAERNKAFNKIYNAAGFLYRLIKGKNPTHKYDFLPEYKDDFEKIKDQVIKFSI